MKVNKTKKIIISIGLIIMILANAMVAFAAVNRYSTAVPGFVATTPAANVFKVAGSAKEFILLNTTTDENSKYFVLAKDAYGKRAYDPNNTQKFDITDANNIAYWLNNDFKTIGNGTGLILPSEIIAHIDNNHVWATEGGWATGNCPTDYSTTCGITVMSQTEWYNNITKFGQKDSISTWGWWLRTGRGISGNANTVLGISVDPVGNLGQTFGTPANIADVNVRPAFYLDKSFFSSVKLDVGTLGTNVKTEILSNYTYNQFLALGYTDPELRDIGFLTSTPSATPTPTPSPLPSPTPTVIEQQLKIIPTADAYVRNGTANVGINYGTTTDLAVKTDTADLTRQAFLKFDLSQINSIDDIGTAEINLYGVYSDASGTSIDNILYGVESDTWLETGITWNNKPSASSYIGKITMNKAEGSTWKKVDITSYIKQQYSMDKNASIVILQDTTPGKMTSYKSKEDALNYPYLQISPNKPNVNAPTWPTGSLVQVSNVGENDMTVNWSSAVDTGAVQYKLFMNGGLMTTTSENTYTASSLLLNTKYTFKIEAVDQDGNTTNDGPFVYAQTKATSFQQVKIGNVFFDTEQAQIRVITGRSSLRWEVIDIWGAKTAEGREAITNGELLLNLPISQKGYFDVNIYVEKAGSADIVYKTDFTIFSPVDVSDINDSIFGINDHLRRTESTWGPQLAELVDRLGVKTARDDISWATQEGPKGVYKFPAEAENMMAAYKEHDINTLMIAAYNNQYYDNNSTPYTDEGRLGFANYAKAQIDKYPDQIKWLEVYNEFNIGFGDRGDGPANSLPSYYYKLLKTTYEVVKAAHPDVAIVGPAPAGFGIPIAWVEEIFKLGGMQYLDVISVHPYRYPANPENLAKDLDSINELVKRYNNGQTKPIWITETGWPTHTTSSGVSEKTQSNYIVRSYTLALSKGVEKYFWYDLLNDGTDPAVNEPNFGIIRNGKDSKGSYVAKPAYASYGVMTRELTGADFVLKDTVNSNIYSFLFNKGGQNVRVAWGVKPENVVIKTSNPTVITDYMGNSKTYFPVGGEIYFTLNEEPVYIKGAIDGISTGGMVSLTAYDSVIGENIDIKLGINNVTASPINAIFKINGIEYSLSALAGENTSRDITLGSMQSAGTSTVFSDIIVDGNPVGKLQATVNVKKLIDFKVRPNIVNEDEKQVSIKVEVKNQSRLNAITATKIDWSLGTLSGTVDLNSDIAPNTIQAFEIPVSGVDYWKSYAVTVALFVTGQATLSYSGNLDFNPIPKKTIDSNAPLDTSTTQIDLATATVKGSGYNGTSDISGNAWINWDDDNFYLTAKFVDDINSFVAKDGDIWQNDSIQFGVSAGIPGEAKGWYEYGISQTPVGPQIYRWSAPFGVEIGVVNNGNLAVVRDEENKTTTYRLALPWTELMPMSPIETPVISFSMVVNENDATQREGYLEWGSGIGGVKDIAKYRAMILMPAKADKTALVTAIAEAQAIHDAAVEGTKKGNYPVGTKAVLQAEITKADAVAKKVAATQTEIDKALEDLRVAVDVFKATLILDNTAPGQVTGVNVVQGDRQLVINWTKPGDVDFEKVKIYSGSNAVGSSVYATVYANEVQIFTVAGLTNGVAYSFILTTVDRVGNESVGLTVNGTPVAPVVHVIPDTTAPGQVTGVNVVQGDRQLVINWIKPGDVDFDRVKIYSADQTVVGTVYSNQPQTFTAGNLTNGVGYTFVIKTVDTLGNESVGVTANGTPVAHVIPDTTAPGQVTGVNVVQGDRQLVINWIKPGDVDFDRVKIYSGSNAVGSSVYATVYENEVQIFTVAGLTNGVAYSFILTTVDRVGNESVGLTVNGTPV
ncbi:MAG: DNRLRE domain-containing protein, partial [Clostridiaceae bacterium]|nr:DNRLRE domain-containing protein [Clostridiaceae bacterium]